MLSGVGAVDSSGDLADRSGHSLRSTHDVMAPTRSVPKQFVALGKSTTPVLRTLNRSNSAKLNGILLDVEAISPAVRQRLMAWAERAKRMVERRNIERERTLLMPDSKNRALWDAINLLLLIWTTFEIPVSMIFNEHEESNGLTCEWKTFMVINLVVDSLFLVDVVVSFNTAYFDSNAFLVDDRRQIAAAYMSSWFLLDVSTSVPLDQIICVLGLGDKIDGQIVRSVKIMRLLKLARILKFLRILKKWEMVSGSKTVRTVSRMCKFVALMIFVTHMAGCLWMIPVVYGNCQPQSAEYIAGTCTNWLQTYEPALMKPGAPWQSKYLAAIYFAVVTLSTVGYGDVTPTNDLERVFAAVLALCGAVIFAYCIGSISTLANQENLTELEIDLSLRSLHDFLQFCNVANDTQKHVKQHLLFTAKTAPHLMHRCLDLLPRRLRYRIIDDCLSEHLKGCLIFSSMDVECRSFLAQFLRPLFVPQNTFLFRALELGMEMFFITAGEVEVLNVTEVKTQTRLRKGDFVGEIALFPSLISYRTSSVRASVDTHVFELRRADLENSIKPYFPDIYESIKEIATVRFRWLDAEPIEHAMAARCMLRCQTLHNEARSYEEQRLAILKKQITDGGVKADDEALQKLLKPIILTPTSEGESLQNAMRVCLLKQRALDAEEAHKENDSEVNLNGDNISTTSTTKGWREGETPPLLKSMPASPARTLKKAHLSALPPMVPAATILSTQEPITTVSHISDYTPLSKTPSISGIHYSKRAPPPLNQSTVNASSSPTRSPRNTSPRRWDEAYPISPRRDGERGGRGGVEGGGGASADQIERQTQIQIQLLTQIQALSFEVKSMTKDMRQMSSTVEALQSSQNKIQDDVLRLTQMATDSQVLETVKNLLESNLLESDMASASFGVKAPASQHASTLKKFGYQSALK